MEIPTTIDPGSVMRGTATLTAVDSTGLSASQSVSAELTIGADDISTDKGFGDLEKYSRLAWLNSKLSIDDEVFGTELIIGRPCRTASVSYTYRVSSVLDRPMQVVAPYIPLQITMGIAKSKAVSPEVPFKIALLNRQVTVSPNGLPSAVQVTRPASHHGVISERQIDLLAKPIALDFIDQAGMTLPLTVVRPAAVWRSSPASVEWSAEFVVGPASVMLNGTLHMDGYVDFVFALSGSKAADEPFKLNDIRLEAHDDPHPDLLPMDELTSARNHLH